MRTSPILDGYANTHGHEFILPPSVAALSPPTPAASAAPCLKPARALLEQQTADLLQGPGAQGARTRRP